MCQTKKCREAANLVAVISLKSKFEFVTHSQVAYMCRPISCLIIGTWLYPSNTVSVPRYYYLPNYTLCLP